MPRVTKRKNELHGFDCSKCGKRALIGVYVIAQTAMGHRLTHICDCGQRHSIESNRRGGYKVTA